MHRVLKSEGLDHLIYGYGAKVKNAVITYLIRDKYRHIAIYVDGKRILFYFVLGNNQDLTDKLLNADPDVLKSMGNKIARIIRFSASGGFNPFRLCNVLFVCYDRFRDDYYNYIYRVWTDLANSGITSKVASEVSKVVAEDFIDILAEPFGGIPSLFMYRSDRFRVRVSDLGDGIQTLIISMLLTEYLNPDIILWDDVESHMNPRTLQYPSLWLSNLVERGKQVVLTTHSLEAATTIARTARNASIVRLELINGELRPQYFSADDVDRLKDLGIDVRA